MSEAAAAPVTSGDAGLLALGLALAIGAALGAFYFGTLWLVVRRLDRLGRPAVWLGATGILRLAVVLGLLALLVGTRWERLVAALVGLVAARVVLTRWLGRAAPAPRRPGRAPTASRGGP